MKVFVATYEHRHGRDVSVYATYERAEALRQQIAADWWERELGALGPMPSIERPHDPAECADVYFAHVGDEYFTIDECEVEGAEPVAPLLP